MILVPYHVDVAASRNPWANYLLLAVTAVVSTLAWAGGIPAGAVRSMTLQEVSVAGLIGSIFLHGGLLHLVGNLLFLWLFGNAICSKIGNLWYLPLYLGLGILAGLGHLAFDGRPAIGASGAINGLVGAYLVLFAVNSIRCFYWVGYAFGTFACSSFWMVLYFLAWDVLGAALGLSGIAHWAHLAGFASGFGAMTALLALRIVVPDRFERTLFQALATERSAATRPLRSSSGARREGRQFRIATPARAAGALGRGRSC